MVGGNVVGGNVVGELVGGNVFHLLFPTRPLLHHRPTPNKKKHPAEKFRMRALGVRHRHPKAASDDAEEQLLRSANASRDYSD